MAIALQHAQAAYDCNEVPVGAIIVLHEQVIGVGHNLTITQCDPTAHAEIRAIQAAAAHVGNYRLLATTMYVTLEPCAMCIGALLWARCRRVVFAAYDSKAGCCGSVMNLAHAAHWNHRLLVQPGPLQKQAASLLSAFFAEKRQRHATHARQREQAPCPLSLPAFLNKN